MPAYTKHVTGKQRQPKIRQKDRLLISVFTQFPQKHGDSKSQKVLGY